MSMSWDKYSQQTPGSTVEVPCGPKDTIKVKRPTGGQLRRLNRAQITGDIEAVMVELFGDKADKVWEEFDELDLSALQAYIQDVLAEMGLQGDPGEGNASSS